MAFIDLFLKRRPQLQGTPVASRRAMTYQPRFEVLESRELLAVAAPSVQLAALSHTQVKLTWTNVANEFGYRVFRWDGAKAVLVSQVAANVVTFTANNLQPNQTQWFSVEAFDNASTARSGWATIMTPPHPLTLPTNLRVGNATPSQLSLSWTDATGETGYRVFGWDGVRAVRLATLGANVTSYVVPNLAAGSTYYFYVQSFNATNTKSTDWVTGQTTAVSISAPTNLRVNTPTASSLKLLWNDATGETGYRVYRWNGVTGVAPVVVATLSANVTGYQAAGLLPGKTYWFYVQAFNATNSANSAWAQGLTSAALPLQAPTQLTVQANGSSSVRLTWTEPARAVGYRVFVWTDNYWKAVSTIAAGTHQATVNDLESYHTHWFMIEAFTDNFAEVSYSSAVFINL